MKKYKYLLTAYLVVAAFVLLGILSPSAAQCPESYTQAQVDAAHCTVGAYIGIPPVYDFMVAVIILLAASIILMIKSKK